ncbi:hypothetical protein PAXINDRAFT_8584 [Paxillus involutus ATCC 200175]|nr:hypothetical protein PAXINDRAFT_8584 [Paxillus involutus ATCC 200175]
MLTVTTSDDEVPVTIARPRRAVTLSSRLKDTNNDATPELASHRTTFSAIGRPSVLPTITASKSGTKRIADDADQSVNLISDTDHADDKGLVKKAAPKAKCLRRMNDAHTSTFKDDNPTIGHGVPVPSSAPNQTTGLGRGAVPSTASKQSTTAGHGMPSNAPPQSTGRTSSVTSINPNRGTSSIMNRAASVTTILEDDSAANGVADTRSLGGGASDFNDEGDGDDGKNDEPTQEAVDEDGFLVDIQVQSIGEPAGQRRADRTADVAAFFGKPYTKKAADGKVKSI